MFELLEMLRTVIDSGRSGNAVVWDARRTSMDNDSSDLKSAAKSETLLVISSSSSFGRHFIRSRCKAYF